MKYLKQHDHVSCGPIGLVNIDKFFGGTLTSRDLPVVYKQCGKKWRGGTPPQGITKWIRERFVCLHRRAITVELVNSCLDKGGCVYMLYLAEDGMWHYSLITNREDSSYHVANFWDNEREVYSHMWISNKKLAELLNNRDEYVNSGWLIGGRTRVD